MRRGRKTRRLVVAALVAAGVVGAHAEAQAVGEGSRAPEIGLRDLDGRPVRLAAYRGKVVIVDVWASWCGPCEEEMPALQRLYARYRRHGLRVVGVSVDREESAARRFVAQTGVRFRNVHDPDRAVAGRYGVSTMPTSWIIDHRGIVRHVTAGFRSGDAREMERVVRRLIDALPDRASASRSSGGEAEADPEAGAAAEEDAVAEGEGDTDDPPTGSGPADAPPEASPSEAGRTGGLCAATGAQRVPVAAWFLAVLVAVSRRRQRGAASNVIPNEIR